MLWNGSVHSKILREIKMSQQLEIVRWSDEKSLNEVTGYLLNRTTNLYLQPRKISGENVMFNLLLAASHQYHLMNSTQESLKGRFSKIEWKAIELALAEETEDKCAGPSVVSGITGEFANNRDIKKLGVNLLRTKKRLESLSKLERDALVDAGNKYRENLEAGLYAALGHPKCDIGEDEKFWHESSQTVIGHAH